MPPFLSPYAMQRARALTGSPLRKACAGQLGAEPAVVFAWITDFPRLPEWVPLVRRAWVDNAAATLPGQVGAVRVLEPPLGAPARETVVAFEPGKLLAYSASDASLRGLCSDHLSVLTTEPHPAGGTLLTWLAYGRPGPMPLGLCAGPVFSFVLERGLRNLRRRFPVRPPSP